MAIHLEGTPPEFTDDSQVFSPEIYDTCILFTPPDGSGISDGSCWNHFVHMMSDSDFPSRPDANEDGNVNTADVVAIYAYIEKGDASGFSRDAVNVNGDTSVNTADVVRVYNYIIAGE